MTENEKKELVKAALDARSSAYAPYSHYPVGAAVLTEDGSVFSGCNVENASYPAGLCAERNAIGSAIAAGKRAFQGIAVAGDHREYTLPCGICLQVLAEFRVPVIICACSADDFIEYALQDLLPHAFSKGALEKK